MDSNKTAFIKGCFLYGVYYRLNQLEIYSKKSKIIRVI